MNKQTELTGSWNVLKTSSARPPGDGKEEIHVYSHECFEPVDSMVFKTEKQKMQSDRCDGKDDCSPTTPPHVRWIEGLHHLLTDELGLQLFLQYLEQEGYGKEGLEFCLACEGIYKKGVTEVEDKNTLFKLMNHFYVKSLKEIQPQTKKEISKKIESGEELDCHIFDTARKEVEEAIMKTTYPNFLQSDLYIRHVQSVDEREIEETPPVACADNGSVDPRHCNLSKGVLAISNNESKDKLLPTLYEDREFEVSNTKNIKPLTQDILEKRFVLYARKARPESEAGHYLKATTPGYDTTCHIKYSSCLPPSTQDSDLQSLSSGALTDDNKSHKDYSPEVRNKAYVKKSERPMRQFKHDIGFVNQDDFPYLPVPKPQKSEEKRRNMSQEEFTKKLQERLQAVQRKQEITNYLHEVSEPQAILDEHVSRVIKSWTGSARQTPGSLTPPAPQPTCETNSRQVVSSGPVNSQPYCYNQHAKAHSNSHHLRYHDNMLHQREMDTYSCDSGAVRDYGSDIAASVISDRNAHEYTTKFQHPDPVSSAEAMRRFKEQAKRSAKSNSKMTTWESRSSFDSGLGLANFSSCNEATQQKVSTWFTKNRQSDTCESERESSVHRKSSPPSLSPIRSQSFAKKSLMGNTSANSNTFLSNGRTQWNLPSSQTSDVIEGTLVCHHSCVTIAMPSAKPPPNHEQHLSMLSSSCADATLDECTRRLESNLNCKPKSSRSMSAGRERTIYDSTRSKQLFVNRGSESQDDGSMHNRKAGRKSCPTMMQNSFMQTAEAPRPEIKTAVAYCFGNGTVPYLSKLHGRNITLKQFKSLISKKGNFKYFFKKANEEYGIVLEEVTEDNDVLPLFEGKIFSVIETIDESR